MPDNKWYRKKYQGSTQHFSATCENPKQRCCDTVPFQTHCSGKTREHFGHRQALKQFDSTMGLRSQVQLTLKEEVSVLKVQTSSPVHVKQFQNKAALKSGMVLNVFLDAFTKALNSDPELFQYANVLYRISAYINQSCVWQRSIICVIKSQ